MSIREPLDPVEIYQRRRSRVACDWELSASFASAWQASAVTTELLERIIVDPAICFGKPTIRGHRLWVSLILGHLAEGWTADAVLAEFPQLEVDDVRACIAYGAQLADVRFADLDAAG